MAMLKFVGIVAALASPVLAQKPAATKDLGIEPETLQILGEFDVAEEGYTLLLPFNKDKEGKSLLKAFPELNSTDAVELADEIIRAHIVPSTILFQDIEKNANKTGEYTMKSLQGFEWTFGWSKGDGGGFPFLVDQWNVTKDGVIEIQMDIRNQPDCPNRIIGMNGFVATPDLLEEATAPAPTCTTKRSPSASPDIDADSEGSGASDVSRGLFAVSVLGSAALGALLM